MKANLFAQAPGIDSKEFKLIKQMVSLVTSFIINGNPNDEINLPEINFTPVYADPFHCLDISNESIKMFELPEKKRMQVWDEVLEEAKIPVY